MCFRHDAKRLEEGEKGARGGKGVRRKRGGKGVRSQNKWNDAAVTVFKSAKTPINLSPIARMWCPDGRQLNYDYGSVSQTDRLDRVAELADSSGIQVTYQ